MLETQFNSFCELYKKLVIGIKGIKTNIKKDDYVEEILNDEIIITTKEKKDNNQKENSDIKRSTINKLYHHLIDIQNSILNQIINNYNNQKNKIKGDVTIENLIENIKKEIPIQSATKYDIFSLKYSDPPILSFEELFSFYSSKNIFNEINNTIDYSKYSEIKFNLNIIEKELTNNLLSGKKLFSKNQIKYKFYSDPYDIEEKTKAFHLFNDLYDKEDISQEEKNNLKNAIAYLKNIFLQNLEILIFHLIKENKYNGKQKLREIQIPEILYLNKDFIQLINDSKTFTINKLISIYEFVEEEIWEYIKDTYISDEFKAEGFYLNHKQFLDNYYNEEDKRELKNKMLGSLLIRFICRYLPYGSKNVKKSDYLFEMLIIKNPNLTKNHRIELEQLKEKLDAKISDAIDIASWLTRKNEFQIEYNEINENNYLNNIDNNDDNDDGRF